MKAALLLLSTFVLSAVYTVAEVLDLTSENFNDVITNNDYVLVKFYAPWCGHCKALAPDYTKAEELLAADGSKVVLARVDATVQEELASEHSIRGYPTIFWFDHKEHVDYNGGRTATEIVAWIKRKTGTATIAAATKAELTALTEENDVVALGRFDTPEALAAYESAARKEDIIPFVVTESADVLDTVGIVAHQNFDDGLMKYEGDLTNVEDISEFILAASLPVIVPFSSRSAQKIFGGDITRHILLFIDSAEEHYKEYVAVATPSAKAHRADLLVVAVAPDEERILTYFGIALSDFPAIRAIEIGEGAMRRYNYENEAVTAEVFSEFAENFLAGKLELMLKSQDVPEELYENDVYLLVAKGYPALLENEAKGALIEFYAPWCGHCKKLAPLYDELGAKYRENKGVIIAKCDATENEIADISVVSFPTIKWVDFATGEVHDYDSGRTVEDFSSFIDEKLA